MSDQRLTWLVGGLAGVAGTATIGGILAVGVVMSGRFDTTAETPHGPILAWATHTTMIHSVRSQARQIAAPASFTAAQVAAGQLEYERLCADCHGGPGRSRAGWASAMTPTPPYLLDAARRWSPAELYWIVDKGVKMTAMPAWGEIETKTQIWNIVGFLEALPTTSPSDYGRKAGRTSVP